MKIGDTIYSSKFSRCWIWYSAVRSQFPGKPIALTGTQDQFYCRNSKQATKRSKKNFKNTWIDYPDRQIFPPMGESFTENGKSLFNKEAATFDSRFGNLQSGSYKENDASCLPSKKNRQEEQKPWRTRMNRSQNGDRPPPGNNSRNCSDSFSASMAKFAVPMAISDTVYSPESSSFEWPYSPQVYYEQCMYTADNNPPSDSDVWNADDARMSSYPSSSSMNFSPKPEQMEKNNFQKIEYDDLKNNNEDSKNLEMEFQNDVNLMENSQENSVFFPCKALMFNREEENYNQIPFENPNEVDFQNNSRYKYMGNVEEGKAHSVPYFHDLPPFDPKFPPIQRLRKKDRREDMFVPSSDTYRPPLQQFDRNENLYCPPSYHKHPWNSCYSKFRGNSEKRFPVNGFSYSSEAFPPYDSPYPMNNRRLYQKRQRKRNRKVWNNSSLDPSENPYHDVSSFGGMFSRSPEVNGFGQGWNKRNVYPGQLNDGNKRVYRLDSAGRLDLYNKPYGEKWKNHGFSRKRFNQIDDIHWGAREDKFSDNYPRRNKRGFPRRMNTSDFYVNEPSQMQYAKPNFDLVHEKNSFPLARVSGKPSTLENQQSRESYEDGFRTSQNHLIPKYNKFNRKSFPPRSSESRWRQKFPINNVKATTFRKKNPGLRFLDRRQGGSFWSHFDSKNSFKIVNNMQNRMNRLIWDNEPRVSQGKNRFGSSDERSLARVSQLHNPWISFDALTPFDLLLSARNQFLSLPSEPRSNALPNAEIGSCLISTDNVGSDVEPGAVCTSPSPLTLPLNSKDQLSTKLTGFRLLLSSPLTHWRLGLCCLSALEDDRKAHDSVCQKKNSPTEVPDQSSSLIVQRVKSSENS